MVGDGFCRLIVIFVIETSRRPKTTPHKTRAKGEGKGFYIPHPLRKTSFFVRVCVSGECESFAGLA